MAEKERGAGFRTKSSSLDLRTVSEHERHEYIVFYHYKEKPNLFRSVRIDDADGIKDVIERIEDYKPEAKKDWYMTQIMIRDSVTGKLVIVKADKEQDEDS